MKKKKVIVTSAGAGPGIAVIKALKAQKEISLEIIAMDMDITAAGLYLADSYVICPSVKDSNFINFMLDYCKREEIDFIIPVFDEETPTFALNKELFKKQVDVAILICDYEVINICNDKKETYNFCIKNNILTPRIYRKEDTMAFPILKKPRYGIGSKGIIKINTKKELEANLPLEDGSFFQEYIDGVEYTIDSISDLDGNCLSSVPRERTVVKAGQSVKGRTTKDPELIEYGKKLAEVFKIKGPSCSQCKVNNGRIYFIEMNPRYGTGVSLSIGAGLNIPLLHLKLALGQTIREEELKFKDNYIMTRYWSEIFIDGNNIEITT